MAFTKSIMHELKDWDANKEYFNRRMDLFEKNPIHLTGLHIRYAIDYVDASIYFDRSNVTRIMLDYLKIPSEELTLSERITYCKLYGSINEKD